MTLQSLPSRSTDKQVTVFHRSPLSDDIKELLSKITLIQDVPMVTKEDKLKVANACIELATTFKKQKLNLLSLQEEKQLLEFLKQTDPGYLASNNNNFSIAPTSLPRQLPYAPPVQFLFLSPYVADPSAVRYMNVFIQQLPDIEAPYDNPSIDPDIANWAGVDTRSFGYWVLPRYPGKAKLRRVRIYVYWNPETLNAYPMDAGKSFFAAGEGSDEFPWRISYYSGSWDRYQNLPYSSNPGNILVEWDTLARLDGLATWDSYGSMNVDYGWSYWQIDMNNDGLDLTCWDIIQLQTGIKTDERVMKVYVNLEIELQPVDFNPALVTSYSVAGMATSSVLNYVNTQSAMSE